MGTSENGSDIGADGIEAHIAQVQQTSDADYNVEAKSNKYENDDLVVHHGFEL